MTPCDKLTLFNICSIKILFAKQMSKLPVCLEIEAKWPINWPSLCRCGCCGAPRQKTKLFSSRCPNFSHGKEGFRYYMSKILFRQFCSKKANRENCFFTLALFYLFVLLNFHITFDDILNQGFKEVIYSLKSIRNGLEIWQLCH